MGKENSGNPGIAQVNLQPSGTLHCACDLVPTYPREPQQSHSGERGAGGGEVLDCGNREIPYLVVGRERWGPFSSW